MAESIYKGCRRKGFTTVYRTVAQDTRLSLKARGLFLLMQSLPENWQYTISGLAAVAGTGKDQIRSALRELLETGYLIMEQSHDAGGKFAGNIFVLQEEAPLSENPTTAEKTASPLSGKPSTGKPSTENPTVNNNNKTNNPPISPTGGQRAGRKRDKSAPAWNPERFEAFWEYYRTHARGEDRQGAVRAWDKLRPDDELIAAMGRALRAQTASEEWRRGIGIPYAKTWLNNARWKDAPKAPPGPEPPEEEEHFGWR